MIQLPMTGKSRKVNIYIWLIFIQYNTTVYGTSLGDICTTDEDCSTLVNTECSKMYDCQTGVCVCQPGYGNTNGDACQRIQRSFGETCGTGYYCNGFEEECSDGVCSCTYWYDYSSLANHCTLRTYRLLTQSCGYWDECLDGDGIACINGYCKCMDGYIADTTESYVTCRPPQWNEPCSWLPTCAVEFDTSTVSDDFSSIVPSCSHNGICECPPSHEHKVVDRYNLCLSRVDSDFERYELGENCTHFNQCESLLCVKCPGNVTGVCMQVPEEEEYGRSSAPDRTSTVRGISIMLCFLTIIRHLLH